MEFENRPQRDFDFRGALTWLGLIALALALLALLWYGGKVLLLVFGGILVAVMLRAPTGVLARRTGMNDKVAYTLVLVILVALLTGFGMLVGPSVLNQAGQFSERVPTIIENAQDYLESRSWGRWIVGQLGLSGGGGEQPGATAAAAAQNGEAGAQNQPGAAAAAGQADGQSPPTGGGNGGGAAVADVASRVSGITQAIFTTLAHLALVLVLGLFLAVNPSIYRRGVVRLFPAEAQQRAGEVVDELGTTLKYWLVGQLALMFITGLLTGIGLVILGIPLALALAFFVFLTEFIPFVGPIIGFIPIVMMAATQGGSTVLWAFILYVAVQQIEGNILTPLIQQRAVEIPPALTVSAVFLAGALFGPVGVILATPLMAVVYVLVKMLYVHDTLGQTVEVPGKTETA